MRGKFTKIRHIYQLFIHFPGIFLPAGEFSEPVVALKSKILQIGIFFVTLELAPADTGEEY